MDAQSLWRVRLGLFIVIFLMTLFVPVYLLQIGGENYYLMFSWGPVFLGEGYASPSALDLIYRVFQFLTTAILPGVVFTMGVIGCTLTRRQVMRREDVSKTNRILTQVAVTAILFAAIARGLDSLMQVMFAVVMAQVSPYAHYYQVMIYIGALCIIPLALFMAFISYDFPRFRALDFAQNAPPGGKRVPEELTDPSPKK